MAESDQFDLKCMHLAIEQAQKCESETGKLSPAVGAVITIHNEIIAVAYRGELMPGEHAEYTAMEKKLKYIDLTGATVYTTLEPCTSRNDPKIPCSQRLLNRGIVRVVIGMLDPNPKIYLKGCKTLATNRMRIDFFPEHLRNEIEKLNCIFISQFNANPESSGTASFDYTNNNGIYTIGHGDHLFETKWTKGSDTAIHVYNDPESIQSIAIAGDAVELSDVTDATIYNCSSRSRLARKGEIVVIKNNNNYFALVKIKEIFDQTRPGNNRDELIFDYIILTDQTCNFSVLKDLKSTK